MKRNEYHVVPPRDVIRPGVAVWVAEKKNYGNGILTPGIVQNVLTSKANHPRGVKVRLEDGTIGRVQALRALPTDTNYET